MAKFNEYPAKTTPKDADKFMLYSAEDSANKLIDYDKLADAVLNKLTSKQFTLDQGTKTLPAALNELNSNRFREIPVSITIENKKLNAKFSIGDVDYGIICLTYQVSSDVYATVLIVYGTVYSSKILAFVSSNANNDAEWDGNSKTFTCTIQTNDTNVENARAILIK